MRGISTQRHNGMARRLGIIGMGWVGSSVAISSLHAGVVQEVLLNDVREEIAEGEAMDLAHGEMFYPAAKVRTASVEEMTDCGVVVISAGRGGRPGESRLDLLRENARIAASLGERLAGCRGVIVVVSNPVDVLTKVVTDASGLPPHRVIGTGTMLDTARLRQSVGKRLNVHPRSIHAQVIGEHGDSAVVMWSTARVGGTSLREWKTWRSEYEQVVADEVRTAAYEIIRRKGATNHAIGMVTASLLGSIFQGERRVLTVSRVHEGIFGSDGVAFSLPAVVSGDGAVDVIEPQMEEAERQALVHSIDVLRSAADLRTSPHSTHPE